MVGSSSMRLREEIGALIVAVAVALVLGWYLCRWLAVPNTL